MRRSTQTQVTSSLELMIGEQAKDSAMRVITAFHKALFKATRGRVGGKLAGMPVVMITTIGRKSGKSRTTMLTSPVQDGDKIVLVASYGGDDRHPKWFLNLRDNPDVEVTGFGRAQKMNARIATEEEKAELWPRVTESYRGYAGYQRRTDRDIPLVILEPQRKRHPGSSSAKRTGS